MKRLPLHIFLAAIIIAGCTGRHNDFFRSVEALMDSAPDSALALAQTFEPYGRADKARRALLITKAKNKAYIDIADDSIIETAVDYYRGNNDSLEVQALYYSAVRLNSRGDCEQALSLLTMAEEKAEQINDFFYLAMTQRLASDCYNELYVTDRAEEYAIKACHNFRLAGKDKHALWCELVIANSLANNDKADSAILILNNNYHPDILDYNILWHYTMANAQYNANNYDEAIKNYEWLRESGEILNSRQLSKLCECYFFINKLTKAKQNLELAIQQSQTWNDSIYIDLIKSKIFEAEGNIEKAFEIHKDSYRNLYNQYDRLLTHPYYNLIDHNLKEEKRQYLNKYNSEKNTKYNIIAIFILAILVALLVIIIIVREIIAKNNHIRLLISHAGELNAELNRLSDIEKEKNTEVENILSEHINLLNNLCSEWYLLPEHKKNGKIFGSKIDRMLLELNSEKSMQQLEYLINKHQANLIKRITTACPKLTNENKRIIIFLALNLSYDSICFLISKNKRTFAVYRHRLKKTIESSELEDKENIIRGLFH